ncbi:MAG: glycosyltransferase [Acidobacteriota bacterium]
MTLSPAGTTLAGGRARRPQVLHLLSTLDPGGTERLVFTLCCQQRRRGSRVEIAVLDRIAPLADVFMSSGIPVHRLGRRAVIAPLAFARLRRLIRDGGFDVVHTHLDLADLYGPFAAPPTVPVISTRHNTDPWRRRRTWKRVPFLLWERAAQRRSAVTIAVSGAVRDFLVREEGLRPERFVVIANGIDLDPYRTLVAPEVARARLRSRLAGIGEPPLVDGRVLVGFVGRLAPQKGVDLLLDAVAQAGDRFAVVLIGGGPLAGELRRQAAGSALRGRVHFAGPCDDVANLLPGFSIFAFPSRWEGFGLAAVEAMAAGLPVVATATDGLREVVVDGSTGRLVPPDDSPALAAALQEMASDPERAAAFGAAGRRRAFETFSAVRMAADVDAVYRRTLGWPYLVDAAGVESSPQTETCA